MKKFVIIGNPLSHSLSPLMQNYWFKQNNIAGEYGKLELEEQELKNITNKIKTGEFTGINITIPFKQKIISFVSANLAILIFIDTGVLLELNM